MTAFIQLLAADIRLVLLRLLNEGTGYALNDSILRAALAEYGHNLSRDRVRTELRWLEEQGLVTLETVGTVLVATLCARGADVATGAARVDGVKRPGPRG